MCSNMDYNLAIYIEFPLLSVVGIFHSFWKCFFFCITNLTVLFFFFTLVNWLLQIQGSMALFSIPLFPSAFLLSRVQKIVSQISMLMSLEQLTGFCFFFFLMSSIFICNSCFQTMCSLCFVYFLVLQKVVVVLFCFRFSFLVLCYSFENTWTVMVLAG